MRITSLHLTNYKRFTDLRITDIPESARLVVLLGPNGSGKSAVFDAFLLKAHATLANRTLADGIFEDYLLKQPDQTQRLTNTQRVARTVDVTLTQPTGDWSKVFCIRSPYRHEADFDNVSLAPVQPASNLRRFERIIDQDRAVSDNFNRLGRSALHSALKSYPGDHSLDHYRESTVGELQAGLARLFDDPPLQLQDLGSSIDSGTFRFKKGSVDDFHYKNLSGGEKAAFDLLLDIFVKRHEYPNAIYCIDEPESHVGSAMHGRLLEALLSFVPEQSQLWIATHSIGFVRKALDLSTGNNSVAFLDFSGQDFDAPVEMTPTAPNQSFFRAMYEVLQHDLAGLVAPACIVLCEGVEATDATIYNTVFQDSHPDTLFVPRGGASDVEKSAVLSVLGAVVPSATVLRLIDRDDMPDAIRDEMISSGIHVLRRREIENYLWDKEVIRKALQNLGASASVIDSILGSYPFPNPREDDMKVDNHQQILFEEIRRADGVSRPGRNRKEFASAHLARALRETNGIYKELHEDVFGS